MSNRINSKSMIRFRIPVILLTFVLCTHIQSAAGRTAGERGVRGRSVGGMPVPERIVNDFDALKVESLEQSIRNLYLVDFYYWPRSRSGGGGGGITLPLPETVGQEDIDRIVGNLRFIKVYDELSQIQSSQASKLINDQIKVTLPLYKKMFSESWDKVFKAHENEPKEKRQTIGPSLQVSDDPNGTPTLAGVRYQLLSLVVLAGNLKLEDTRPAIESVVSEAVAQRNKFYDPNTGFDGDRFSMLTKAGLYNRQVLATGVFLTSDSQTAMINENERWETRQLARYNPLANSPYEMMMPSNSGGLLNVMIHKPIDDDGFDKVFQDVIAKPGKPSESPPVVVSGQIERFIKFRAVDSGMNYNMLKRTVKKDQLPLLYKLLNDDDYAPYWHNIARIIGYISDDPNSIPYLLNYFKRDDGEKVESVVGKIWSIALIGKIGGDSADAVLKKAITKEGAEELAKEWIDEAKWKNSGRRGKVFVIEYTQNAAIQGLVYSGKKENWDIVEKLYNEHKAITIKNKTETDLMNYLTDAMAIKALIVDNNNDVEAYFRIDSQVMLRSLGPYLDKYQ